MGAANMYKDADRLIELLDWVRSISEVHEILSATLIFKGNDGNYYIIGDDGVERAVADIYGGEPTKRYRLCLRILP